MPYVNRQTHFSWPLLLAVWATFLIYGAIAAPVPGVNEPHYLCKAKHFWQPDWCPEDFFLASPNAHTVFYATFGSLTRCCSLTQSAWIGRTIATFILACGWTYGIAVLLITRWGPLWTAWLFLAFAAMGNFSGEWLVGGVEGKVPCYGLLLAAFGDVLRRRWSRAAIWTGIAISFHPVVGCWGLLAFLASCLTCDGVRSGYKNWLMPQENSEGRLKTRFEQGVRCVLPLTVMALPGLIPVIELLREPAPYETQFAATYIQVYFRLAHHLDPMRFTARAYAGYTLLGLVWISSLYWGGRTNPKRRFDHVVAWAVCFAILGILIGWGPRPAKLMPFFATRMQLLKFYPFRLADVLLPLATSLSLISLLERTWLSFPPPRFLRDRIWNPSLMMWILFLASLCRAGTITDSSRFANQDRADWLDVCHWANVNLPVDAIVQSPTNNGTFKWFAGRAEYIAFKDCPQDAAGIVEWNRRLNFLHQWYSDQYADEFYAASELRDLRRQTHITHLLTVRLGPLELEPIYRNGTFQVYDLTSLDE